MKYLVIINTRIDNFLFNYDFKNIKLVIKIITLVSLLGIVLMIPDYNNFLGNGYIPLNFYYKTNFFKSNLFSINILYLYILSLIFCLIEIKTTFFLLAHTFCI